jgi:putative flippase GtrA
MRLADDSLNSLHRLWRVRLTRYTVGGLFNMVNRLLLVLAFASLGVPLALNYALVHLLTFAVAFFYHTKVTFGVRLTFERLSRFLGSVILIRALDYGFVLAATASGQWLECVSSLPYVGALLSEYLLYVNVVIASFAAFLLRYLLFTRFTFSHRDFGQDTRK